MIGDIFSWIHKTLCPPPLSPLFQEGGRFAGFNEDLTLTAFGLIGLFVVDNLIVKRFIQPKVRYFALHTMANAVTAIAALPDVVKGLTADPRDTFSGPAHTMVSNSMVAAIHIYHCLAFNLRREDIIHHAVFVTILCGLAVPLKQVDGIGNTFGCFFLSGVPGGLIYLNLCLVAHGYMSKLTEKKLSAAINVWLRGPSMVVYTFLGWSTWMAGRTMIHPLYVFLCVMLHFTNGQYYAQQSVESLAVFKERLRAEKSDATSASSKKDE
jgi:hypothetical protein